MFLHSDIKGNYLTNRTLCLTYDDGPGETEGHGPRTSELASYLARAGIAATFFVIGEHEARHRVTLDRLRHLGHIVGNHTRTHPGLATLAVRGGDVSDELTWTEEVIRAHVSTPVTYFRAPYGNWRLQVQTGPDTRQDDPISIVAPILNRSERLSGNFSL